MRFSRKDTKKDEIEKQIKTLQLEKRELYNTISNLKEKLRDVNEELERSECIRKEQATKIKDLRKLYNELVLKNIITETKFLKIKKIIEINTSSELMSSI